MIGAGALPTAFAGFGQRWLLGVLASYGGATVVIVLLVDWAGAALMMWGAYEEWQASKAAA
jgi:hypothetical protein